MKVPEVAFLLIPHSSAAAVSIRHAQAMGVPAESAIYTGTHPIMLCRQLAFYP